MIIYGYFSLALKVLSVPDSYSGNQLKKLDGLQGKVHGEKILDYPCFLIGQLARNDHIDKDLIAGEWIVSKALSIIKSAMESIGGRIVLIECRNNEKLINFYKNNEFNSVNHIVDSKDDLIQMFQVLSIDI